MPPTATPRATTSARPAARTVRSVAAAPVREPLAWAIADLADHPEATPSPTATLLVATDPGRLAGSAPDESLILAAPLVPATAAPPLAPSPAQDELEAVSWVDDIGTWGTPLLVGAVLLLALTGPSGLRRLARRRSEA